MRLLRPRGRVGKSLGVRLHRGCRLSKKCCLCFRYLRCFYFGLLTVSNIHEQEERHPVTVMEYVAEMIGYMFGIFVLAVVIGEVL